MRFSEVVLRWGYPVVFAQELFINCLQMEECQESTLAVCAADDMLARWHDEFAGLIPGAVKAVIPGIAADPEATAEIIEKFLRAGAG